jgi:hypothetical protein
MAGKILEFNQCLSPSEEDILAANIEIQNIDGTPQKENHFQKDDLFQLIPRINAPESNYSYKWKLYDSTTGQMREVSERVLRSDNFTPGQWIIELSVQDATTGNIVSTPSTTLVIDDGGTLASEKNLIGAGDGSTPTRGVQG